MKEWIKRNRDSLIATSFLIPILLVAFVSVSHVTQWYGITNPMSWAIYLSLGIEIAALSALAGITVGMRKFIYVPFGIVTLIQLVGNIFFAYQFIDITSKMFLSWVELVSPLFDMMGVDPNDLASHKRILSLLSGGLLPLISLTFLHMLVKFKDKTVNKEEVLVNTTITPEKEMDLANEPMVKPAVIDKNKLDVLEQFLSKKGATAPQPQPRESFMTTPVEEIKANIEKETMILSNSPSYVPTHPPTLIVTDEDKVQVHEEIEQEETPTPEPTPQTTPFMRAGDRIQYNQYDNPNRRV